MVEAGSHKPEVAGSNPAPALKELKKIQTVFERKKVFEKKLSLKLLDV